MKPSIVVNEVLDPESCAALAALFRESFGESVGDKITLVSAIETGGHCLAAYDGTAVVGGTWAMLGRDDKGLFMYGMAIVVKPEYQGDGVGQLLCAAHDHQAIAKGIDRLHWTGDPLNYGRTAFSLKLFGDRHRGAFASRYIRDCYGPLAGALNEGRGDESVPSDRIKLTRYPGGFEHSEWKEFKEIKIPCVDDASGTFTAIEAVNLMRNTLEPLLNEEDGYLVDIDTDRKTLTYKIAFA